MIDRLHAYHLGAVLVVMLAILVAFTLGAVSIRVSHVERHLDELAKKGDDAAKAQWLVNKQIGETLKRQKAESDLTRREVEKLKESRNEGAKKVP